MKVILLSLALVLFLGIFFLIKKQKGNITDHPAITRIDKIQLLKLLEKDSAAQLIDVRTTLEHNRGHIKPSVNIDYMGIGFSEKFKSFDKEKPMYLYCRSGNRSNKAAHVLATEGFTKIYDLKGGILEWNKTK